jgi:octanoyl-[GcvH]:protein N-octanoyltransferase
VNALEAGFNIVNHATDSYVGEPLEPFALEELLCREVGRGERSPLVHIWRHEYALILGLRDRRLPQAEEAIRTIRSEGCQVAVRNSGGAAVPLDDRVVNVSVIIPNPNNRLDHRPDFERMYLLLRDFLQMEYGLSIDKGEVQGSYCPGEFDLSVGGRKLCGISQRRQTKALIVQAFIVVSGTGEEKALRAKRYYDMAAGGASAQDVRELSFPVVEPKTMVSLEGVLAAAGFDRSEADAGLFIQRMVAYLKKLGGTEVEALRDREPYRSETTTLVRQLQERYDS